MTIVFAVLGVIVCDLKALGMATCMGGGSSKTRFHCIWNACRRYSNHELTKYYYNNILNIDYKLFEY
jgi:hypothetical protein